MGKLNFYDVMGRTMGRIEMQIYFNGILESGSVGDWEGDGWIIKQFLMIRDGALWIRIVYSGRL